MALSKNLKEIKKIEFELNCSLFKAIEILSHTVENFFLPWFISKTQIKGFITGNKFLVWPNTLYSGIFDIVIEGELIEKEEKTILSATARILPTFSWLPNRTAVNWMSGTSMVLAWFGCIAALFLKREIILMIFGCVFAVTCLYNLIQFKKYLQNPELVDIEKRFVQIFKPHIINS
jgi:hypothetical protein